LGGGAGQYRFLLEKTAPLSAGLVRSAVRQMGSASRNAPRVRVGFGLIALIILLDIAPRALAAGAGHV